MTRLRAALARRDDAGMTLTELIVSMGIFVIVLAVFMAGVVQMTKSTARAQAVSDSGSAVRTVFQRMDKQVRYATAINRPGAGTTAGTWYVEYLQTAVDSGLQPLCTQWRYLASSRELQVRSWRDVPGPTPSAWQTQATNVRNNLADTTKRPFVFVAADTVLMQQQLKVYLDAGPGPAGANARKGSELRSVFVARNSSTSSASNRDDNADGLSDTPVCAGPGRP